MHLFISYINIQYMLRITTFVHTAVLVNSQNYTNLMLGYPQKYLDDWPHRLRQGTEHDVPFVVEAEVKSTWVIIERLENFYICMYVIRCQQTEIARRIAKLSQAPFIKVEATKFTEVIYVYKCM